MAACDGAVDHHLQIRSLHRTALEKFELGIRLQDQASSLLAQSNAAKKEEKGQKMVAQRGVDDKQQSHSEATAKSGGAAAVGGGKAGHGDGEGRELQRLLASVLRQSAPDLKAQAGACLMASRWRQEAGEAAQQVIVWVVQ